MKRISNRLLAEKAELLQACKEAERVFLVSAGSHSGEAREAFLDAAATMHLAIGNAERRLRKNPPNPNRRGR